MVKKVLDFIKDKKQYILIALVVFLIIIGVIINNIPKSTMISGNDESEEEEKEQEFTVLIRGEIVNPNAYCFDEEMYLFEIIDKAGGLTKYANIEGLNLIEKINSDSTIVIGKSADACERLNIINYSKTNDHSYLYIENTYEIYIFDSYVTYEEIIWKLDLDNSLYNLNLKECINDDLYLKKKKALLNINKATYEDLINLNVLSSNVINNILSYIDQNGSIDTVDELSSINGIGDKTLEKLLNLICFK